MSGIILKTRVSDEVVINKKFTSYAIICIVIHPQLTEHTIKNLNKDFSENDTNKG